jgi:hypothetical protein
MPYNSNHHKDVTASRPPVLLQASALHHDPQLHLLMGKNINNDNHYWDHITASHPYGQRAMS